MKLCSTTRALVLLMATALCGASGAAGSEAYLFVNGHVVPMTGEVEQPPLVAKLLVEEERIVAIGPDLEPRGRVTRIDLRGGYLLPGLTEMHAHVPGRSQGATYRDEVLYLYLANGITTIRGMLGAPEHLELRGALARQEIVGPRLITAGPSFNGNSVTSPAQAARMAEEQANAGYDFLKIHPGLTLAEYDAVAAAARERGIPFAGHVPADVGLAHALAAGQATIDHLDGYVQALVPDSASTEDGLFVPGLLDRIDIAGIETLVAATRRAGAAVVPTETLLENLAAAADPATLLDRPENVYLPARLLEGYRQALARTAENLDPAAAARFVELRKMLLRQLSAGGVMLLLGSDAPQIFNVPGFSLHRELVAMTAAGLTPWEALSTGTRNPARFFGADGSFGTLVEGASADLIWLAENPLDDIAGSRSIRGVMARGRWFDRTSLDAGLAAIAQRQRR